MTLFATTAITGPNGEQILPEQRCPDSWARDDEFVVSCLALGYIVERDEDVPAPLPATPAQEPQGNRDVVVDVGAQAERSPQAEGSV